MAGPTGFFRSYEAARRAREDQLHLTIDDVDYTFGPPSASVFMEWARVEDEHGDEIPVSEVMAVFPKILGPTQAPTLLEALTLQELMGLVTDIMSYYGVVGVRSDEETSDGDDPLGQPSETPTSSSTSEPSLPTSSGVTDSDSQPSSTPSMSGSS